MDQESITRMRLIDVTASDDDEGDLDALDQAFSSPPPSPPLGEYLSTSMN